MVERKQFKDKDIEKIWNRIFVKKWSKELQKRTREEMATLFAFARMINKLKEVFGTVDEKVNIVFALTTNFGFVLFERGGKSMN